LNESGHGHVYEAAEKPLLFAQTAAVLEVLVPNGFHFSEIWRYPFDCFLGTCLSFLLELSQAFF